MQAEASAAGKPGRRGFRGSQDVRIFTLQNGHRGKPGMPGEAQECPVWSNRPQARIPSLYGHSRRISVEAWASSPSGVQGCCAGGGRRRGSGGRYVNLETSPSGVLRRVRRAYRGSPAMLRRGSLWASAGLLIFLTFAPTRKPGEAHKRALWAISPPGAFLACAGILGVSGGKPGRRASPAMLGLWASGVRAAPRASVVGVSAMLRRVQRCAAVVGFQRCCAAGVGFVVGVGRRGLF